MEIRQIQYAIALAELKNFSRAADKLHLAQPSLSQQISKLEKELGVLLFERNPGELRLTYAGQQFIEQGTKILDQLEQLKKEMMDVADLKKGQLIIGSLPITGAHLLPVALKKFQWEYPGIEIILVEETTSNLEMLTIKGQTDISLLSMPVNEKGLEIIPILEEEILLAVPPNHRFASMTNIDLEETINEPFILLKKGQGFRQIAHQLCEKANFEPNVVFESTNIETVKSLVASGMGISFIPKMVTRTKQLPEPVYVSIGSKPPTRTLVLGYKKNRYLTKAAKSFITIMQQITQNSKTKTT